MVFDNLDLVLSSNKQPHTFTIQEAALLALCLQAPVKKKPATTAAQPDLPPVWNEKATNRGLEASTQDTRLGVRCTDLALCDITERLVSKAVY